MSLQHWIDGKFKVIATKLPTLVHTEPASFACGYNTGYKQALLDLDRFLEDDERMSDVQDLIDRCTRMSLLLGMVTGCLLELVRDDRLPNILKQPLLELVTRVTNGVDELYYKEKPYND